MARAYSLDLRERVVAAVAAGQTCRAVAVTVWGERGQCGEVVAAFAGKWQRCGQTDGWPAAATRWLGERDWLLARIAEKPDLTLRALGGRAGASAASKVSYFAVWQFFEHEGISFKKNPARQRAGSARRRPTRARWKKYQAGLIPRAWSSSTRPGPRPT